MLIIDGSYGEGGGQIIRSAIALSVLTKKPVTINNIRSNRSNPGLRPQHFTAIKIMKTLCNAKTKNIKVGSSNIEFIPGILEAGNYNFNIGTAGSIILVFQTCILGCLKTKASIKINLIGGTDVKWAPTWDYFEQVFLPLIKKMGVKCNAQLIQRGYYPTGGGEAQITINPCEKVKPFNVSKKQDYKEVFGKIHLANLPEHIGTRMKHSAIKTLLKKNLKAQITIERATTSSAGTGITLWSKSDESIIGTTMLGEQGILSEKIGESAAKNLLSEINKGVSLDVYAFDQIIPYLSVIKNNDTSSFSVREISSHAQTNIWLVKQFLNADYNIKKLEDYVHITV